MERRGQGCGRAIDKDFNMTARSGPFIAEAIAQTGPTCIQGIDGGRYGVSGKICGFRAVRKKLEQCGRQADLNLGNRGRAHAEITMVSSEVIVGRCCAMQ